MGVAYHARYGKSTNCCAGIQRCESAQHCQHQFPFLRGHFWFLAGWSLWHRHWTRNLALVTKMSYSQYLATGVP